LIAFAEAALSGDRATAILPSEVAHIWEWFCELAAARTSGGMALNPITYPDIEAWARLTDSRPTPWEVSLLRRIDNSVIAKSMASDGKFKLIERAPMTDDSAVIGLLSAIKARANG